MDQIFNLDAIFNKYGFPALMVFFFVISFNPNIKMITDLIIDLSKQINSYQNTNLALIHAMHQLKDGNMEVACQLIENAEAETKISKETMNNIIKRVAQRNESVLSKLSAANLAKIKGKNTETKEEI